MKKAFMWVASLLLMCACSQKQSLTVTVANSTALDRSEEMVEVAMDEVSQRLEIPDSLGVIVLDAEGNEVPTQVTSDGKLIFPASVKANASANYTIQVGKPMEVATAAYGKFYPERVDDIAWENDQVAFRTYGPALQASGERAFGYDVCAKNVPDMVVVARYANELNPATKAVIDSLRAAKQDAAADSIYHSVSYHVDHGNGLDCYKVGPTLGGGTAALLDSLQQIVYPYCFKEFQILDNGPLRFSVRLTYNPLVVNNDSNVVETRVITLDKGSHLNKTVISYENLSQVTPVAAGLVIHPENPEAYVANQEQGFIAYEDLTDNIDNGNGKIYVGAVFPAPVKEAKAQLFSEQESKDLRGGATGHVLGISDYQPGSEFTYYWGSGWTKAGMESMEQWTNYLNEYAQKVRNPLTVTLK
jgi:hypothetical protein